jgi:hypothetical protein
MLGKECGGEKDVISSDERAKKSTYHVFTEKYIFTIWLIIP